MRCAGLLQLFALIAVAGPGDVDAMLDLSVDRRERYKHYHPLFHRPSTNAREQQRPYFESLIANAEFIVLVARCEQQISGFAIGHLVKSPPVYDPGGLTCVVDDFAVDNPDQWQTVGSELLTEVRRAAKLRGAVQIIAVVAPEDSFKRELLFRLGLRIVSEWLVGPV